MSFYLKLYSRIISFVIISGICLITSCDNQVYYEKNNHIESAQWNMDSVLIYDVNIVDSIESYDFYLNIRHNDDYEFSNLFLFIDTYYPNAQYTRDTIEILMADATGKWYGKGFGDLKEIRVLLKRGVYFPIPGDYNFSVAQAMRKENLLGIEDFGIRIEKMQR